jgi:cytochrome c-type biogenesis protein CcmH
LTEAPEGLSRGLAIGAAGLLVALGGWGYWVLGAPGYPDMPLAQRHAAAQQAFENRLPQAEAEARVADLLAPQRITPPEDIAATVAEVRAGLETAPDDLSTLTLLRDYEAGTRHWPEAAALQSRIVQVLGDRAGPGDLIAEIDLMVLATNGYVSAEAKAKLDRLQQVAPESDAVGWFLGLMAADSGRPDVAFSAWRPLAEEGDPDSPFTTRARAEIERIAFLAGVDYVMPPLGGVTEDDIAGMVAGLAARLATDGGPASDWARLIRSYVVLGETDQARAIWAEAQNVFAADPLGFAEVAAAAQEAGLVP